MSDPQVNNEGNTQSNSKQSNPVKSVFTIVLFLLWIILMVFVLFLYKIFNKSNLSDFYLYFHKGACWIFSIDCKIEGTVSENQPTLFLSNHISYLDIIILGAHIPAYFIAKSEVAGWPLLGLLAKLQNTLFFERKGNKVHAQIDIMAKHFTERKNLILFPEGTSTNGEDVLPFKSSLLKAIEHTNEIVYVQPVTLCYSLYKHQNMNRSIRDHYAWYDTMPFGSHFFGAAGMGHSQVILHFHPPVALDDFETRKECAEQCYFLVRDGLKQCLNK